MTTALEELRMKHILLTEKRKQALIGSLTLDEKLLLGAVLNYEDDDTLEVDGLDELDGELGFGNKTYEDGMETFVNNRE